MTATLRKTEVAGHEIAASKAIQISRRTLWYSPYCLQLSWRCTPRFTFYSGMLQNILIDYF